VTILLNYHIGRIVLGSMCGGVSVWLGWSDIRVTGFSLQHAYHSNPTTQHYTNSGIITPTGVMIPEAV